MCQSYWQPTPKATEFLAGLERDNSKEYWTANKGVFESEVKEPMAALVDSLPDQSCLFKTFRMNRDIRFQPTSRRTRPSMGPPTKSMARSITCTWMHRASWRHVGVHDGA